MTTTLEPRTRVFIVDDHELVRDAIVQLVGNAADLHVIGEAGTAAGALTGIRATEPDVAVLDVQLPDGSGIDICRQLQSTSPKVRCIMLTAHPTDRARDAAILAGAAGFLTKDIRGLNLAEAIRDVAAGRSLIDPATRHDAFASAKQGPNRFSG
jgi:DNA-binding NarL/FixJ family response regulator